MEERRINLIADLLRRQSDGERECPESIKEAVHIVMEDLLCDCKFDRPLLNELLMAYGWTPDDVEYFDIADMFIEEDEE